MTSIFDEDFSVNDTTPFGFTSVHTSVGCTDEVIPLGSEVTPSDAWSGVALRGGGVSTVSLHRTYPWMPILGVIATWKQIQPTSYNAYTWPAWFDQAIEDAHTADLNGHPYKISLRVMMGADAPVGPTGASWMIGGLKPANNNKPVEVANTVGNDTSSGTSAINVPVPWDLNYRYHHDRLIDYLETQLAGMTTGGVLRSDYIFMVAVAMPTEKGSEMSLGYGPHQQVPSSGSLTVDGHTYTTSNKGYINVINKASWAKHVPPATRAAGQAAIDLYIRNAYHDAWDYAIAKHMNDLSVDSSVAWGGVYLDNLSVARALIKKWVPTHGRSKLISLTTSLRIYPPRDSGGSPDFSITNKTLWSYRNFSPGICDLMLLVKGLVPTGTLPKMGFQTAGNVNSTGGYGMPPQDFPHAAREAYQLYGAQFIETYTGVFTSSAYGAGNRTTAQNVIDPALAANAALVTGGGPTGGDNVFHTALGAAPAGTVYGLQSFSDVTDAYYLFDVGDFTLTTPMTVLKSLITGSTGVLTLILDTDGTPILQWDGVTVWTDTTLTIAAGDEVEVHHFVNGSFSGFEIRLNALLVVGADNLVSDSGGINAAEFGLIDAAEADLKLSRVAADDAVFPLGGGGIGPGDPPLLTIQPLAPSISVQQITITATAQSDQGIGSVTAAANDGPTFLLAETSIPGTYQGTLTGLLGTAGVSVQNMIAVAAQDASADPLTTIVETSVAVLLAADDGGGNVAFSKTMFLGTGQFAAMNDRFMALGHFVEGVAPNVDTDNTGDATSALEVSANGSSASAVDIAPGYCVLQGDDTEFQGPYADFNDAVETLTSGTGAPTAGNQRVDIVTAFLNDSEHTTRTPQDGMAFGFVAGSPSAGADLSDKSTWPDLPPSRLPLALALWDDTGIIDILDCRKAYGPGVFGADGERYRLAVTSDGLLGTELVLAWPDWVVTA